MSDKREEEEKKLCQYCNVCPYYDKDSYTCNVAIWKDYCGAFRRFREYEEVVRFKKMDMLRDIER